MSHEEKKRTLNMTSTTESCLPHPVSPSPLRFTWNNRQDPQARMIILSKSNGGSSPATARLMWIQYHSSPHAQFPFGTPLPVDPVPFVSPRPVPIRHTIACETRSVAVVQELVQDVFQRVPAFFLHALLVDSGRGKIRGGHGFAPILVLP
ncbi:hypothetical protein EJ02DRAFT_241149 [Clathrospora elynae]|uniref:Uncharacterized protein n=1 Tax=Clathrospora elynae TaxID=706981 RepID=A0A6A5SSF0_9PLEO|nr:hypothetical protein EJ02DRAFT_241149 [Clathrospora elynae]